MADGSDLDHDRMTTVWSVLLLHAHLRPNQPAMLFEGRSTTYQALLSQAISMAGRLFAEGHRAGDRIGYLGKNSDLYFALFFAMARLGCVMVPLNWRLANDELAFIVEDSEMTCLLSDAEFADQANRLVALKGLPHLLLDDTSMAPTATPVPLPDQSPDPDAIVFQVYTSGTTGRPKGAMLSNANLLALRAPGYRAGLQWFPMPGCSVGQVLPVAHIAGTAYALFGFYAGARVVIAREFDAGQLPDLIASENISHILLAPAAMQLMLEHPAAKDADFSSLSYITYGAAPIPETLLRRALERIGCGFVQMYGMTEAAGGVVALQPQDHISGVPGRLRSAGTAMPGVEIGIIGDDWTFLPPESTGEVVVKSAAVMPGYWKRAEANREVLGPDGWMRTGDIGRIDEEGYLFILDRAKDTIISGGENVYPAEVENAIFGHPDVSDVAVVGAPSAKWGEEVIALIVPREGAAPDLASILSWLDGKLARFKLPKQVVLIETMPRNAGNKILRRVLREPFWEGYERRVN